MNLTFPKSISEMSGVLNASGPAVNWKEPLGGYRSQAMLPATNGYECAGTMHGIGDSFGLDLYSGEGDVTSRVTSLTLAAGLFIGALPLSGRTFHDAGSAGGYQIWTVTGLANDYANRVCKSGGKWRISLDNDYEWYETGTGAPSPMAVTAWTNPFGTGTVVFTHEHAPYDLTGAAGTDIEGAALAAITVFHGLEIACTAGGLTVALDGTPLPFPLAAGGVLHFADGAGTADLLATLTLTATAIDTAFNVTVLGH